MIHYLWTFFPTFLILRRLLRVKIGIVLNVVCTIAGFNFLLLSLMIQEKFLRELESLPYGKRVGVARVGCNQSMIAATEFLEEFFFPLVLLGWRYRGGGEGGSFRKKCYCYCLVFSGKSVKSGTKQMKRY